MIIIKPFHDIILIQIAIQLFFSDTIEDKDFKDGFFLKIDGLQIVNFIVFVVVIVEKFFIDDEGESVDILTDDGDLSLEDVVELVLELFDMLVGDEGFEEILFD